MNYRHAFHAGNPGDVLKHACLALILARLEEKPAPFCVIDTHAGIGAYDLTGPEAARTGEWQAGIGRLYDDPAPIEALRRYLEAVRAFNADGALRLYPGSPALAAALMRADDRLIATELHEADAGALADHFRRDRRVKVVRLDGYLALKSFLPPKERRGLVLVDPPFEVADEFHRMVKGLGEAHRRWATGIYVLWYPIKGRGAVDQFHGEIAATGIRRILVAEMLLRPVADDATLAGAGLLVVNPPWRLDGMLATLTAELARRLAADGSGTGRVEWLVPE